MCTIAELKRIVEEVRHELIGRTEKIYGLYDSEIEETQDKLRATKIGFYNGGNEVLGRTLPITNLIELNWRTLLGMSLEQQREVVIHEFFHVISYVKFKKQVGHRAPFKRLVRMYGYPARIGMATIEVENRDSHWRYKIVCDKCGRVLGYRNRKSDLSRYVSTCCKSEIVFIENEGE